MTRTLKALAVIEGKDKTGAAFNSAAKKASWFQKQMAGINAQVKGQQTLMRAGGAAIGGAVAAVGVKKSLARFAETERGMTRIGITGEATAAQVQEATNSLRELAFSTAMPFDKVTAGLNALVSAGIRFPDAMAMIPDVAKVAQATGAEMAETATTADAALQHMNISSKGMGAAFDAMAAAGKAGKFEFKDMARYLPSILPAAKALGYTGQEGIERVSALLQTIRAGTGTAEEAATALSNIFQKMESEETSKKFSKMGVDLRKEMDLARKKGDDLVQTFLRLTDKALKGDMSKLPQLIGDLQFGTGVRSLSQLAEKFTEVRASMKAASGTIDADFKRVMADTQAQVDITTASFDRLTSAVGRLLAVGFNQSGGSNFLSGLAETADRKSQEIAKHGSKALLTRVGDLDKTEQEKQGAEYTRQGEALVQKEIAAQKELNELIARRSQFEKKTTRSSQERVSDLNQRIAAKTVELGGLTANIQSRAPWQSHVVDPTQIAPSTDARDEGNRFRNTPRQSSPVPQQNVVVKEINKPKLLNALPQSRPSNLGSGSSFQATDFGDDGMAKLREEALKAKEVAAQIKVDPASITQSASGMENLSSKADETKNRAAQIVSEVIKIGPAGQAAGAAAGAGAAQMESQWMAAIGRIKSAITGLGSAAAGVKFNTGTASAGSE